MPAADPAGLPPVKRSPGKHRIAEVVKPKNMKGTLSRLWSLTKGRRQGLWLVFVLSGLASLSAMLTPLLIGKIIDSINNGHLSVTLLVFLLLAYIGDWAVRFAQNYIMASVSQRMICYIRKALFDVMKDLPLAFFDRSPHGDLMSRLTNDIDNISSTISDSLAQLMMLVFTCAGVLGIMPVSYTHLDVYKRQALRKAGMEQVPVISLNLVGLEDNPGFKITPGLTNRAVIGMVYGDLFQRVLYATKPYEQVPGSAMALYNKWKERVKIDIRKPKWSVFKRNVTQIVEDFDRLPRIEKKIPKVAIVGEIPVSYTHLDVYKRQT